MPTSQTTFPFDNTSEPVSRGALGYIRGRNRQAAYDLFVRAFKQSGLKQSEVASRLGKGADNISRLFRRPRNMEIDTLGELIFAITGGTLQLSIAYPKGAKKSVETETATSDSGTNVSLCAPKLGPTGEYGSLLTLNFESESKSA